MTNERALTILAYRPTPDPMSHSFTAPPSPPDDSPYWMRSALDIRQLMKALAKQQEKVTIWAGRAQPFISAVLDVSEDELVLDFGADAALNAKTLAGANIVVTTTLNRVDIRFEMSKLAAVKYDGAMAFVGALPEKAHKLQRREYFRLPTPVGKPLQCHLFAPANAKTGEPAKDAFASVLDIGLGGLCLLDPGPEFKLMSGEIHRDCQLDLGEFGLIMFDLEICHVFDVENRLGKTKRRAGCRFPSLGRSAEAAIQRYMAKLERDRRALGQQP